MALADNIKAVFSDTPGAVQRQGEDLFVKVPLYKAKRPHTPIYINRALFKKLFFCAGEPTWGEMSSALESFFSSTIEKENSTGKEIGFAYADYQTDPLGLSLAGNLGSGRAYYVGSVFNIKGERTPLATSEQKKFSDGLLEMERCIWETVVANALQGSITTGLSSVLAILDMNEMCEVSWRDAPVKRGKIIRIDLDGELDRITHLFQRKQPLKKEQFQACARTYGRLEGDKFIERITHGTWSPGNISPQGHLIDFDTVAAVKGRSPQFSATRWHHENYFGTEYYGQLKVIKSMTDDPHINAERVDFDGLKEMMLSAMREQISTRFIGLMGFKDDEKIYKAFKQEVNDIVELWIELARKGYKKHEALFSKNPLSAALQAFDTSAFLRIYPMLKRLGLFTPEKAVALMSRTVAWEDPYEAVDDAAFLDIERRHLKDVYAVIGEHFIEDEKTFQLLKIAALGFVKKYDRLHEKILMATQADMKEVEARAYVINEDRGYMFPAYTISYKIAKNKPGWGNAELSNIIESIILSNWRVADSSYMCDVRLYEDGYVYTWLDGKGKHRRFFSFFNQNKKFIKGAVEIEDGDKLDLEIDNARICQKFTPEEILHTERIKITYGESAQFLKSLLDD